MCHKLQNAMARIASAILLGGFLFKVYGCDDSTSKVESPDPGQQGQVDASAPMGGVGGEAGAGGETGAGGEAGAGGQAVPPFDPELNPEGTVPVRASTRAQVKFKGGERWARDLAKGLELPREAMCRELGQYDCVEQVHRIALGGVEPYRMGIHDPLPVAPVTAALAVDRVALAACDARVQLDLDADGSRLRGLIFVGFANEGRPEDETLKAAGRRLYDRLLRRDPDPDELQSLLDFYNDEAGPRDWALGTCFAVASSMEALFY